MDNKDVWAPDPTDGYVIGKIIDIGPESITVQPASGSKPIVAPYDRVFPSEEYSTKDVEDNCALMYLNEATLLNNVRMRYMKNCIYTYVANILIAVNPYFEIKNMYTKDVISKYQGKSLGVLPPHVFAIADKGYREMKVFKTSQSIIVSGESGAGKTETTKYILKYLTENYGQHAGAIEQRIVESNPLLEAFGNAKTVRNNNSSRFGKFVEIHFDNKSFVVGGYISHYLLEKSRICVQSAKERNYHIFYRLCAGAPDDLKKRLYLKPPDQFHYLNRGNTQYFITKDNERSVKEDRKSKQYLKHGSLRDIQLDDLRDFKTTDVAMKDMGLSDPERNEIYTIVAGVLHLGNIEFEEDTENAQGESKVSKSSEASLDIAAGLLQVDANALCESLTYRITQAAGGGGKNMLKIALRREEATSARDALAKAVYSRLFDHIVARVNQALPFSTSQSYMGVLDIAGFEYFEHNSFEQFCINYCNEKLQQFFNQRVLKEEQALYEKEGLGVKKIEYVDNQDNIDLVENKGKGILDLLDEESKLPKPSPAHYTSEIYAKNKNHYRLMFPRKSKLKAHREIRDDEGFLIRHFAGAVVYHTDQFIEKNNDALHASLEGIVQGSKMPLMRSLFDTGAGSDDNAQAGFTMAQKRGGAGKLNFISVGSKFRSQLNILMDKLRSTGTSFIRCVKPNGKMIDHCFEGAVVLSQLQCAGMTSVLDLMQQGYPSRTRFDELYNMYMKYLPPQLSKLDPRLFCKLLFKALGLDEVDFKFGLTKVFFRPGKFAEFDQLLRSDPENLAALVAKVRSWLLRYRWRKAQYCALEVIKLRKKIEWRREQLVKVQKTMRMWICVKKFQPRIRGMFRLGQVTKQLTTLSQLVQQLKGNEAASAKKQVDALTSEIEKTRRQWIDLKTPVTQAMVDRSVTAHMQQMDNNLKDLRRRLEAQKKKEEEERLRKIQEEMERERKRKEEEERKRREEEEERRRRAEIEERRRKEEEERKKQEERDRIAAAELQKKMKEEAEKEAQRQREQEQERLDRELALRLASEDTSAVEDISAVSSGLPRSAAVLAQRQAAQTKKHDLSKWKYAELRDTINTSCDVELLTACREEFHRRLKVYHEWKQRNKQKSGKTDDANRAPQSVLENGRPSQSQKANSDAALLASARGGNSGVSKKQEEQRFFRIPFVRPSDMNRERENRQTLKGFWWAHFDGPWVARQMEVMDSREPILLLAGVDDMAMCELPLAETNLTTKKGAEISESEFEREWSRIGGDNYIKKNSQLIASSYLRSQLKS